MPHIADRFITLASGLPAPPPTRRRGRVRRRLLLGGLAGLLGVPIGLVLAARAVDQPLFCELEATEVGVVVDQFSGDRRVLTNPGLHLVWPLLQRFYVLDRRPVEFRMQGEDVVGRNQVPYLSVRATDGSEFWFEDLVLHYAIDAERADLVLFDSGPEDSFQNGWAQSLGRSILREEFGRLTTEETVDPGLIEAARETARERIQARFAEHGLRVVQLLTPKPQFDRNYEKAIADRKQLEQEAERWTGELGQRAALRAATLKKAERKAAEASKLLESDLLRDRLSIEAKNVRDLADAESYAIGRTASGNAERAKYRAQAQALAQTSASENATLTAEIAALAENGDLLVRRELVGALSRMRFQFLPTVQAARSPVQALPAALGEEL